MIITTYACDREGCNTEQTNSEHMWEVSVNLHSYRHRQATSYRPVRTELWCRSCVINVLGALPEQPPKTKHPDPIPTLEDIIRILIREETGE